ncbi:MAG: single-stranded-DNA-specific exonuclease RecJ, partial [Bryobacteraceae bacterium]
LGLPATRVLWQRGYRDPDHARRFLAPTLEDLHDPYLLQDMDRAVARLHTAVKQKEKILLYGDYDVDGTSSVVILMTAIRLAGGEADFHVPHRLRDGYGMRTDVVEEAAARGVRLIISVDTGIRAQAVVEHANSLGIDVIVTDHHLPESKPGEKMPDLPPAVAVLNPNRPDCAYPEKNLCGAGVTFKLIQAFLGRLDWPKQKTTRLLESFLKLTAIATVADVVPLTGENRVIVKHGLDGLRDVRNAGLKALIDVAGFKDGDVLSAGQVAFRIAPRINAAGRMASASDVVEMFLTTDAERARTIANQLNDLNTERQQTEAGIIQKILDEVIETPVADSDCALIFAGEGWHRGVVGIVASRVVDRFHRPAFVLGIENGVAQGSGRSIPQFHLLDALESMPDLFGKFGGHRQAAGLTMSAADLPEFRRRLNQHAAALLTLDDFQAVLEVSATLDLREATDAAMAQVLELAPFGFGNPAPTFAIEKAELTAAPEIKSEKHAALRFRQNGKNLRAMAWNFAERAATLSAGQTVDLAVSIEPDPYSAARGYSPWQAIVKDIRS